MKKEREREGTLRWNCISIYFNQNIHPHVWNVWLTDPSTYTSCWLGIKITTESIRSKKKVRFDPRLFCLCLPLATGWAEGELGCPKRFCWKMEERYLQFLLNKHLCFMWPDLWHVIHRDAHQELRQKVLKDREAIFQVVGNLLWKFVCWQFSKLAPVLLCLSSTSWSSLLFSLSLCNQAAAPPEEDRDILLNIAEESEPSKSLRQNW